MNISEAKKQIEQSVQIYLMKDQYGNYRIPLEKQRPIFLLGAPGIGKTAIMEQISRELDLGLVAYSMTHHTRQSALGLPFIARREYEGETYDVSLYTMSEIIATIYETMKKSGKKEGILFLDEINCVSETLGPSMLQFLQYKTFGNHRIPRGWVVVTAGNPPEFNRSVHEFDVVTMDRLKVLSVEPDYDVWKEYAIRKDIHKSILTYLDIKKEDFYSIESTVDGKTYVTARGWEDLSEALKLYEECGFEADETLMAQYIGNKRISGEFAAYYELYNKYRQDYHIQDILSGKVNELVARRARKASFDERVSIMGLLLEAVLPQIRENILNEECIKRLLPHLRDMKAVMKDGTQKIEDYLHFIESDASNDMAQAEAAHGLSESDRTLYQYGIAFAQDMLQKIRLENVLTEDRRFALIQREFAERVNGMKQEASSISRQLDSLFAFVESNFGDGNEMLILVTELTVNHDSAQFIAEHGCDPYYKYNKKFLMYERNRELMDELNAMLQRGEAEAEEFDL